MESVDDDEAIRGALITMLTCMSCGRCIGGISRASWSLRGRERCLHYMVTLLSTHCQGKFESGDQRIPFDASMIPSKPYT